MILEFEPEITVEFIFSKISEDEIFELYGVPVQTGMFTSPLRYDRHPTCRFYRNKRLIMVDFSGHFRGDCFALVMFLEGCNFPDALYKIYRKIKHHKIKPVLKKVDIPKHTSCKIDVESEFWDYNSLNYWIEYGISSSTLEKFKVCKVRKVWLNDSIYYNRIFTDRNERVFAYYVDGDWKVYFPERSKMRFLHSNPDLLQGYSELPDKGEVVIITKAMKDVMALYEFGIPAVAPMSETHVISDTTLEDLSSRFNKVFALYDRDRTGISALLNMRDRGIKPLLIPKGAGKDFSDCCKANYAYAATLVNKFKESL